MGLFALCMGILNSLRHFFAPAFAPVFLNICIILSVFLFYHAFQRPVMSLAVGVVAGGGGNPISLSDTFFIEEKDQLPIKFQFTPSSNKANRIIEIPGIIGTAVYQLNVFIDTIFASFSRAEASLIFGLQIG